MLAELKTVVLINTGVMVADNGPRNAYVDKLQ